MPEEETLFAVTTPGLESAVVLEAQALGWHAEAGEGGVMLRGPSGQHRRANLHLRCATRVLLRLAEVPATDERVLGRALARVGLGPYAKPESPVDLHVTVHRNRLRASRLAALARKAWGLPAMTRPVSDGDDVESPDDGARVHLRVDGSRCAVSVDTSGAPLHLRGYRQELSRAPLRETLAAGLLVLAGYDGSAPLWDPMCGSGTLPIEAAWIAMRRAPGLGRQFAFEAFPSFDAEAFRREVSEAESRILPRPPCEIRASDLDSGALGVARRNARRAQVKEWLTFERLDFTKAASPTSACGWLVSNLPYGKRVGERAGLEALYARVGEVVRAKLPGWKAVLLAPDSRELGSALGLSSGPRLLNGGIRCRAWTALALPQ